MDALNDLWFQKTKGDTVNLFVGVHKLAAGIATGVYWLKLNPYKGWLFCTLVPSFADLVGTGMPGLSPRRFKVVAFNRGLQIAAFFGTITYLRRTSAYYRQLRLEQLGSPPARSWWDLDSIITRDAWESAAWQKTLGNFDLLKAYKAYNYSFWGWLITFCTVAASPALSLSVPHRDRASANHSCFRRVLDI